MRRGECTPHFLWSCQRKRAVHGPKEKRFSSKLARSGKFGDATVESHDRIKPARSHPGALYLGNHPAFKPQVVTLPQISGCLSKRPTFGPAAAPLGVFPKRGPQPPLSVVLRGGLEGESRNPPPMSLFDRARPFLSPREKWGRICPAIIMAVTHPERMPPPSFENTHTPVFSPCASCILASHSARRQWGHTATRT